LSAEANRPCPPQRVTARDVLKALSEVRRRKHWPLFQELEAAEPDLTEFILEEISAIHHTLLQAGVRPRTVRRLQQQVQTLVLVCVLAPRGIT
jgi:hypothetical protein